MWILAASTGGIQAVPEFLSLVPRAAAVALVYVQHLVEHQHSHLIKILLRHCNWRVSGVNYGLPLAGGQLVVPAADERFDIGEDGCVGVTSGDGWQKPYSPNIDDVALQVAGYYGNCTGIIVFSGMGSDGCRAAACIRALGGQVWVQSPDTCAAVSMPQAVIETVTPDVVATVPALAEKFNREILAAPRERTTEANQ